MIQNWVTKQADAHPDATAIHWKDEQLTFGCLEALTNQLARIFKDSGCRRGDRIAIGIPKSPEAIVGMIAALKADCVYVPLDTRSPVSRLRKIVESCRPVWLLGANASAKQIDELFADEQLTRPIRVGCLEPTEISGDNFRARFSLDDVVSFPAGPVRYENVPADAAHILFTSGSTGTPKGVVITHENVVSFVEWAVRHFDLNPADRVSGHAPLHFDLSTFDVLGSIAAGAQLHLVPPELNLLPHKLAEFIRSSELTQWFSVPSTLNYLASFDAVEFGDFPLLKRVMWCGEVFPTRSLIHWMQRLPHAEFTNLYGPTEATIASSYYTVPSCPECLTDEIPIGRACDGEVLLVLDEWLETVPPGETGDLYIGGVGLSPGYWRDRERTDAVFVENPQGHGPAGQIYKTGDLARVGDDGLVYFLGRADTQIKSRGYRIELGEIETALNGLIILDELAVVAIDTDRFEGKLICCAYVPSPEGEASVTRIKQELRKEIPGYMVPVLWRSCSQLPKNANGKIDRPRLQRLFEQQQNSTAPAATPKNDATQAAPQIAATLPS
jgi:amino acid adenylation domain-containing protein